MSSSSVNNDGIESPSVIDLFCGGGGFMLGAHQAGFRTAVAVDVDRDLTARITANFPSVKLAHLDLSCPQATSQVLQLTGSRKVAGVIGGPPCQGFSEIGRRNIDDPRNRLVRSFMEVVKAVRPKFFVMENVPALAWKQHSAILESALDVLPGRYQVLEPMLLNAADYGAPTQRRRMVLVGYDPEWIDELRPDSFGPRGTWGGVTVRDAISDLPEPSSEAAGMAMSYREGVEPSTYAKRMRGAPPPGLGSKAARAFHRSHTVTAVDPTLHTRGVICRFAALNPGERDSISRYPRLRWDEPAPVLRAGTGRDRGSYQAARPIHPDEPRVITVREAARIQGFPDWFQFGDTKWHSHRMIGNSVSPIFAKRVLGVLRHHVDSS